MKTSIEITGLRFYGRHGVAPQERSVGNEFIFDIYLKYPFTKAAETDTLAHTLNYADIVAAAREVNSEPSLLLENLAWRLMKKLTSLYPAITSGSIKVAKLIPPIAGCRADSVGVKISW